MAIQVDSLRCDLLEVKPSGRRRAVERSLIPPLHPVPGFLVDGGSTPSRLSISPPASSVLCIRSPFSIVLITRTRCRRRVWIHARSLRVDNLFSMSLHMHSKIQSFFLSSRDFGFGVALRRTTKSPSSIIGLIRGRRGIRVRRPSYSVCYLRGVLRRHPITR